MPIRLQPVIEASSSWLATRATQNLWVVARLRPGDTRAAAEAKIGAAVAQLSKEHPRNGHLQLRLTRPGWFGDNLGAPVRAFAWGLFGLGVLLMMAGCSNLAGLLLARGNDRAREIALRTALGAGKTRIARQLLTESMLLAACGGLGGAAIAWAGTRAISARRLPTELPVQFDVTADLNVLLFATAAAIVVGLLVGVAPARFASRLDLNRSLKSSRRRRDRRPPAAGPRDPGLPPGRVLRRAAARVVPRGARPAARRQLRRSAGIRTAW